MKKMLRYASATLCALLFMSACAAPVTAPGPQEERVLSDVRVQYRDASLVLQGVCVGSHYDASGEICYDISVAEVLAGSAEQEDLVHCFSRAMKEGETYLLFLGQGEDVHYAEDTPLYELLSEAPLLVKDENVVWDGKLLSIDSFREELEELKVVINAPAPVYYYNELRALVDAADEIFIGRVSGMTEMASHEFSMRNGGSMERAQYDASIVTVETYGSIKGVFSYGQEIEIVYSPDRVSSMQNAATLQPMNLTSGAVVDLLQNGIYVFFLVDGPDDKQEYFFPINSIQGFASLSGEDLRASAKNAPLQEYDQLTPLVLAMQEALRSVEDTGETPALIVEE